MKEAGFAAALTGRYSGRTVIAPDRHAGWGF